MWQRLPKQIKGGTDPKIDYIIPEPETTLLLLSSKEENWGTLDTSVGEIIFRFLILCKTAPAVQITLSLLHCVLLRYRKKPLVHQLINQLQSSFKVCYEPTDENKASKPFLSDSWKALTYICPNLQELKAINRTLGNPLPAGIEHSQESVVLTLLISHNLDQERAFSSCLPFQSHWVITQQEFMSSLGIFHLSALPVWVAWPRPDQWSIKEHSRPSVAPCANQEVCFPHFVTEIRAISS